MSEAPSTKPDLQALFELFEASGRLMQEGGVDATWLDSELTLGQLRFVHLLSEVGPLSIGQIAAHLNVTLASASQFVGRLERGQYVERSHRSDDRRVVDCRLGPRGRELAAAMRGMQRESFTRLMGLLEPAELRDMERLLRVIASRLQVPAVAPGGCHPPSPQTP